MTPRRWPLLLGTGLLLIATAVGVGASGADGLNPAGQVALMVLGAACLGAFVYAAGGSDHDDTDAPP